MPERKKQAPRAVSTALTPFCMPSLGADMDAGTILEWLVAPGATVHRGDVVAVVQTDKSDLDVEVFHDGVLAELVVPAGEKVPVGTVIAMLAPAGATVPTAAPPVAEAATPPAPPAATQVAPAVRMPPAGSPPAAESEGRLLSPLLRHLAESKHVDVAHLHGSGPAGRITRDDIEHAGARARITPRARRLAREHGLDIGELAGAGVVTGEHVTRHVAEPAAPAPAPSAPRTPRRGSDPEAMRQAIARLMTTSWQQIPHYRVSSRIDVDATMNALALRNAERAASERILPAAVLLRAAARAAAAVPAVNGHWVDGAFAAGDGVHVGVVVSLRSGGLLAPVIRDAATKDLATIMDELRDLVTRARSGHLRASEISGATITVTDLGEGGVDEVSPIIHPPQVAIVGFGAVHDEVCAVGGEAVVRAVVRASLAADHRAIDGRIGSLFLTTLAHHLQETPEP